MCRGTVDCRSILSNSFSVITRALVFLLIISHEFCCDQSHHDDKRHSRRRCALINLFHPIQQLKFMNNTIIQWMTAVIQETTTNIMIFHSSFPSRTKALVITLRNLPFSSLFSALSSFIIKVRTKVTCVLS